MQVSMRDQSMSMDILGTIAALYILDNIDLYVKCGTPIMCGLADGRLYIDTDGSNGMDEYYKYHDDKIEYYKNGELCGGFTVDIQDQYILIYTDPNSPQQDEYELTLYTEDGMAHRENGPAFTHGGVECWLQNNEFHRVGGPAHICGEEGTWYVDGAAMEDEYAAVEDEHDIDLNCSMYEDESDV